MKLGRVMLASALGVGASGLGACGQQQPPPPPAAPALPAPAAIPPPTTQPTGQVPEGVDVGALAQGVRQAPDPSAAVAAYATAVGRVGAHLWVEDAYVRRMVEFNLPDLAEAQAQDIVKQDPNNDVAQAVVAYVQGRRGQAVDALATIVRATGGGGGGGGDRPVTDPFVLRTAGQLVAWYDTRADKAQIPDQLKADVEAVRQKLAAKEEYGHAYASARDAYNGQPPTASSAPTTVEVPQPQQPLQPQPEPQPLASSYDTSAQPTAPAVAELPPPPAPVAYDDSYVYSPYPYGYSSYYYYRPSYYWPRNDHWGHSYAPPVIVPNHHRDWDHNYDWHDGRGPGHGSGDHDGHDGNHGGQPGGGGGGQSPRVNSYNDTHVMRSRDDNGPAKRAIEPGAVKERPMPPAQPKGRDRADVPSQPVPQPRQQRPSPPSEGGTTKSPKADVSPRTERKPDPPAAARQAPSSPAQQPRSNSDRSGSQQPQQRQQQQQSNDRNGKSR